VVGLANEYLHLEHDGKLLLVDHLGNGPIKPLIGRHEEQREGVTIRLPSLEEVEKMGIGWEFKRTNRIRLGNNDYKVTYGVPEIPWPENWAWKDAVISDSSVDPIVRESVYRTLHRVVSKVVISNTKGEVLMAKSSRGFFTGCWTLPGGFVDYGEHPRKAAVREAWEELGIRIVISDPFGESGDVVSGKDGAIIQNEIFNEEGINWLSFTYSCVTDLEEQEIVPKEGEIDEAKWFTVEEALASAVSKFDISAIKRIRRRNKS